MRSAYALLFGINLVYATSYAVTRLTLDAIPPSLLAFARLVIGAAILVPLARWTEPTSPRLSRGDTWRIVWMGVFGFAEIMRNLDRKDSRHIVNEKVTGLMPTRQDAPMLSCAAARRAVPPNSRRAPANCRAS